MSALRLGEAARVLRERAEAATPGPWTVVPGASNVWHFPEEGTPTLVVGGTGAARVQRRSTEARLSDAAYIATVHPGVGLALADWLDAVALRAEEVADTLPAGSATTTVVQRSTIDGWNEACRLADLILGGDR